MKKLYLEFIRGSAAVFVVFYHLIGTLPNAGDSKKFAFGALGPYSVVMFFILSGCVINISQTRKHRSQKAFLIDRIVRLYPQFILGLLIGLLVTSIVGWAMPSAAELLGNFLMVSSLQGFIVKSINANLVVWSLSFEMFFYVIFLLTIGRRQKQLLKGWLALSLIAVPLCCFPTHIGVVDHCVLALAFSALWLIGYYVYEYRDSFYADGYGAIISLGSLALLARIEIPWEPINQAPVKYFLFGIGAIPFFRFCLQTRPVGKKISIWTMTGWFVLVSAVFFLQAKSGLREKLVWCALTPGLLLAYTLISGTKAKQRVVAFISGLGAVLGKYSYSLYIGHLPFLVLFAWCFPHNRMAYIVASLVTVAVVCYVMESLVQKAVAAWVKKPGGQPATTIRPVKTELAEVPVEKR